MKPVWNTEKQIYYNYDNYYYFFFLKKEMCIDLKKKGTIIKGEKLCMVIHDQHWKGYLSFCNVCTFSFFFFTYSPINEIKTDIYISNDRISYHYQQIFFSFFLSVDRLWNNLIKKWKEKRYTCSLSMCAVFKIQLKIF